MQYVHLGRSGVKVSRLCLGTMNFGPEASETDSFAIMDRAMELGINFFDTANVYGWKVGEGWTEQIVGRWLKQGGGRRDKIVLATKVFGRMGDWPNQSRLSALHIKRACEESLRRLGTDCIDLYQMHHVDRQSPWEEIWQAMEQLVREGKILYVGSSNFAGWHLAQAQELAKNRHFLGLVSEQSLYNLVERTVELEVIPACEAYGIGLIPWSPLARGLLAGVLKPASVGRRADEDLKKEIKRHRPKIEAYEKFCRRGAGLVAPSAGGDGTDHRATHVGAVERLDAGLESHSKQRTTHAVGRDLPWARRTGTGSLRLVGCERKQPVSVSAIAQSWGGSKIWG
jgi:aryl-alcohol dehydrogenase-like predicted oxidoreductase